MSATRLLGCSAALLATLYLATSAHADTVTVANVTPVRNTQCKSNYALRFADQDVCLENTGGIHKLLDKSIKISYTITGSKSYKNKPSHLYAKIVEFGPPEEVGSQAQVEHRESGFMTGLNAVANGINVANGAPAQPTYQPTRVPAASPKPVPTTRNQTQSTTPAVLAPVPLQSTKPQAQPVPSASQAPNATAPSQTIPTANASDLGSGVSSPGYCSAGVATAYYFISNASFHTATVTVQVQLQTGGVQADFSTTQNVSPQSTLRMSKDIPCGSDANLNDYGKTAILSWQFY